MTTSTGNFIVMSELPAHRPYHHGGLREALLEAAENSLRTHGLVQLSLRDLAREIGVSHAAPRRHFADRQALLDALAEVGFQRLGAALRDALARAGGDFSTRIQHAVSTFARFATENGALLELMNSEKHQAEATDIADAARSAFEPVVELIEEGQTHRELGPGEPEEIGLILYATVHGISTLVNAGMIAGERLEELVALAVDQFLHGAAPHR